MKAFSCAWTTRSEPSVRSGWCSTPSRPCLLAYPTRSSRTPNYAVCLAGWKRAVSLPSSPANEATLRARRTASVWSKTSRSASYCSTTASARTAALVPVLTLFAGAVDIRRKAVAASQRSRCGTQKPIQVDGSPEITAASGLLM